MEEIIEGIIIGVAAGLVVFVCSAVFQIWLSNKERREQLAYFRSLVVKSKEECANAKAINNGRVSFTADQVRHLYLRQAMASLERALNTRTTRLKLKETYPLEGSHYYIESILSELKDGLPKTVCDEILSTLPTDL